ncbi:Ig-like domain-containing protein [Methylobacter sp. YRD-M1]|uniref:Ig-like domain-containing protein n=1 Tax=Methylobacter sp. YRD-M1 TaxID=2911520 RepID=UPI00227BC1D8|nr:multicopper oxidase domain-containing protein [Methylobacter sp. YRD-M1]WAK01107.1 multicopper oxidase domain-containing protein [Methylobacter sp. YRD-M1]
MKNSITIKTCLAPITAACSLALAASPTFALDYYLAAKPYTKILPDGSNVPMWGYVEDAGGACYNAADNLTRQTCIAALPAPTLPGPRISVPVGDTLTVSLSNGLPEPTSIIIPGQERPTSTAGNGPTWNDGSTGPRANAAQKVRSYGREAAANGGRELYIWSATNGNELTRSGTFLYHSGTHPQKQVYMGLYGAVTRDAAAGQVYPGVSYDNEVMLFYSDIDPAINQAVANGTYTTSIDYQARWFLINGEPYNPATKTSPEMSIPAGASGTKTLVRFLSTASETHVPALQGLYAAIHGEDGLQYNYQEGGMSTPSPREQYSIELPPLKTRDAIVTAPANGAYAVYDGNGYMTNPSDPADPASTGDTAGGMLRFLSFSEANLLPSALADINTAEEGGVAAGGNVLSNDNPGDAPASVTAASQGDRTIALGEEFVTAIGGRLILNTDGSYRYIPPASGSLTANVAEVFSYTITDANGDTSRATLTVTVADVSP